MATYVILLLYDLLSFPAMLGRVPQPLLAGDCVQPGDAVQPGDSAKEPRTPVATSIRWVVVVELVCSGDGPVDLELSLWLLLLQQNIFTAVKPRDPLYFAKHCL